MHRLSAIILLCSVSFIAYSQEIKLLEHQEVYASAGVMSESQARFKHGDDAPQDSCARARYEFDVQGRILASYDFFACGRTQAIQRFYHGDSSIDSMTVEHAHFGFQPLKMELIFDENGKLIERVLPESIPNYWKKEHITHGAQGGIVEIRKIGYQAEDEFTWSQARYRDDLRASQKRVNNTLNHVYAENGLQLLEHIYDQHGLREIVKFYYEYHSLSQD